MKDKIFTKIYLLFSSVIQILISLFSVIFSKVYLTRIITSYEELLIENNAFEQTITMYKNFGLYLILVLAIITIIFNTAILLNYFRKKNKLNYKMIMIISVINILFNESVLISTLSIINLVVIWLTKMVLQAEKGFLQDIKKEKKKTEVPYFMNYTFQKKDKWFALFVIILYFLIPELIAFLPFGYISKSIILDIILIIICFMMFYDEISKGVKFFKSNFKNCFSYIFNNQVKAFVIYFLTALLVVMIKNDAATSVNQQIASSLPMLYIVPSALIYAPFVEEIVFRGAFRRLIKNDRLFILVSAICFGLLHTLYETTLFDFIILSLPYAVLGGFFAYLYDKTGNITSCMVGHFLHNAFACLMMLLS